MNDIFQTPTSPEWLPAPDSLNLPSHTVDVWRGIVDLPPEPLQECWTMLSETEQDRAKRFRFPIHQNRFIAAHGMLRHILGQYLSQEPHSLSFSKGSHGKPYLDMEDKSHPLFFNLAHSQRYALVVISQTGEVGIDIEENRAELDLEAMIPRIFSEQERTRLQNLPPPDHQAAFFSCWTKKEAYTKARGDGLTLSFKRISVEFTPGNPPSLLEVQGEPEEPRRWMMWNLFPAQGYTAALVARGSNWNLRSWDHPFHQYHST